MPCHRRSRTRTTTAVRHGQDDGPSRALPIHRDGRASRPMPHRRHRGPSDRSGLAHQRTPPRQPSRRRAEEPRRSHPEAAARRSATAATTHRGARIEAVGGATVMNSVRVDIWANTLTLASPNDRTTEGAVARPLPTGLVRTLNEAGRPDGIRRKRRRVHVIATRLQPCGREPPHTPVARESSPLRW